MNLPKAGAIPVIETNRLRMRGHGASDFAACLAMWKDPAVTQHIGGRPFTPEEVWARLLRYVGHWTLLGFGYWLVEEKATGQFVGEVGFADFKRDLQPPITGLPEIGWALASPMQGKGFATESVRAATAWSDRHLGSTQTVCIIDPGNLASLRVAEKCGYRKLQQASYKGQPTTLFGRQPHAP